MITFRFDCETYPIRPGLLAPKVVCLQHATDIDGKNEEDGDVHITTGAEIESVFKHALQNADALEAHNGCFDYVVLCAEFPNLTPFVFKALADGKGRDTLIREQLTRIASGTFQDNTAKGFYSLAGIAKRRLGIEMDKGEDTWRLKYALLEGIHVGEWPKEALDYALGDVVALRQVSRHQLKEFTPKDEWLHVAAAFALQLAATWGLKVDPIQHALLVEEYSKKDHEAIQTLIGAGLYREDGSVDKSQLIKAVERACIKGRKKIPKTEPTTRNPQGQTKTDVETLESLKEFDPSLKAVSEHNTANKMLETYLGAFEPGIRHAMTSRPNPLVATGRTSWGGSKNVECNPWWPHPPEAYVKKEVKVGTNLQNLPGFQGLRETLIPRPGHWICSVDYNSLELRTLGQACLWLIGYSTFAKGYQADPNWDPHTYFGGQLVGITYEEALKRKKEDKSFKKIRAVAKAANFSFPGGVGAKTLHGQFMSLYESGQLEKPYSLDECYAIKDSWLAAYPEMKEYFDIAQYHAQTGDPVVMPVSGRIRGGLSFCNAANTWFQGIASDLAKRAFYRVSQASYVESGSPLYGSRPLVFIHDEILAEVPIDKAHEAAVEIQRLMSVEGNNVCPDVPILAEAALATRWIKAMEPAYTPEGRLTAWDLK